MSAFTAELGNQPGELARLCEAMAGGGVNLLLCTTTHGDSGVVAFIAADEAAAQTVLTAAGIGYLMRPAVTVKMDNRPGAGAAAFRKPADAGVNVDLLLLVRISDQEFCAVICADDPPRPRARWAARPSADKAPGLADAATAAPLARCLGHTGSLPGLCRVIGLRARGDGSRRECRCRRRD